MKIIFFILVHFAPTHEVILPVKISGKFNKVKQFQSAIARGFALFVLAQVISKRVQPLQMTLTSADGFGKKHS
jgi:hypothetical protein